MEPIHFPSTEEFKVNLTIAQGGSYITSFWKNSNIFIDVIIVNDCKTGKKVFHNNKFVNVCVDLVRMLWNPYAVFFSWKPFQSFTEGNAFDLFVLTVFNLRSIQRIFKRITEVLNRGLAKSSCCCQSRIVQHPGIRLSAAAKDGSVNRLMFGECGSWFYIRS